MNQLPSFLQLQLKHVLTQTSRAFVPREEMSAIERALVERILVLKDAKMKKGMALLALESGSQELH
mgnify:CR=1 FL=1